ncbi:Programmed cell death protein 2-like [Oopsacas minuta]|uniref:Programmed cell death protein 2-like n=1 Tax=Oopsacas minuta TaxID=111878 RepID=A0AAV7K2N0_9METZ|nr:Programmed cell death protein 2-like [Oopsacas minuta]
MSADECLWLGYIGVKTPMSSSLTPKGIPTQSFIGGNELVSLHESHLNQPPTCTICDSDLLLIIQLYWPLYDSSYHRLFHVFACRNNSCWNNSASWVVLRSLSKDFSYETVISEPSKPLFEVAEWDEPLDEVEVIKTAESQSSQISQTQEGANLLPSKLSDLSIQSKSNIRKLLVAIDSFMLEYIEYNNIPVANEDNTHELSLYNEYLKSGGEELSVCSAVDDLEETDVFKDKTAENFYQQIGMFPSQVVRYQRGGEPLWASDKFVLNLSLIPNCESCGSKRTFEFQLLPTLVDYLKIKGNTAVEFGNLLVFTCAANCWKDSDASFKTEYVIVQPDPDIHGSMPVKPI